MEKIINLIFNKFYKPRISGYIPEIDPSFFEALNRAKKVTINEERSYGVFYCLEFTDHQNSKFVELDSLHSYKLNLKKEKCNIFMKNKNTFLIYVPISMDSLIDFLNIRVEESLVVR